MARRQKGWEELGCRWEGVGRGRSGVWRGRGRVIEWNITAGQEGQVRSYPKETAWNVKKGVSIATQT